MNQLNQERPVKLAAYSIGELAAFYEVHRDTMRKWLKPFNREIGARIGRFYSIHQVQIIFERLGWPEIDS